MRKYISLLFAGATVLLMTSAANGQDATVVDPDHYQVEFENDQIRVLRITYGPNEKSVMHEHPNGYSVILTDGKWKMTNAEGESEEIEVSAGDSGWRPAETHLPENLSDHTAEVVLVELKASGKD
jgi:quercetin dioxygenase-like cupin family protein